MSPAIWLITRGVDKFKDHQLELAVAATGGVHYHAHRDRTILDALDQIGTELHAQYVVGYAPAAQPVDGFHEIKVTVTRPDTTLRTRPGYFLAPPNDVTAPASVTNCRADTLGKSSTPE